jgi:hypothetical protein
MGIGGILDSFTKETNKRNVQKKRAEEASKRNEQSKKKLGSISVAL